LIFANDIANSHANYYHSTRAIEFHHASADATATPVANFVRTKVANAAMSDSTIPRVLSPIWIAVRHGFGLVNVALRQVSRALWKNAAGLPLR